MATTQLSDAQIPIMFNLYGSINNLDKDELVNSGIAYTSPTLQAQMSQGGKYVNQPYWDGIPYTEPTGATDDPTDTLELSKHTSSNDIIYKQPVVKGFSAMDLVGNYAGSDPMQDIVSKIEKYWQNDRNHRYTATATGILNNSIASHDEDMVNDITAEVGATINADNIISGSAFLDALATTEDQLDQLGMFVMHSIVYTNLRKQNLIDYQMNSDHQPIPYYMNTRVLVDNNVTVESYDSGAKNKYTTLIFGQNVFAVGAGLGSTMIATEYNRNPLAGNGGGEDQLISRRQWAIGAGGYSFDGTSISGNAPTLAELATGSLYTRNVERKRIKIAGLISNG